MTINHSLNRHMIDLMPGEKEFFDTFFNEKHISVEYNENTLLINASYVGYVHTPHRKIILESKYSEININHILRMYYFVHGEFQDYDAPFFDISENNYNESIISKFLDLLEHQVKYGIFHDYQDIMVQSSFIKGNVDFPASYKNILLNKKEPILSSQDVFNTTNQLNKVISKTLEKIQLNILYKRRAMLLQKKFADVDTNNFDINEHFNFSILNKEYEIIYFLGKLILTESFFSNDGNLGGESLLINFDNLFEQFVFKILITQLPNKNFTKWESPKKYASISKNSTLKKYSPDVILDYDDTHNCAKVVMDVKNKAFGTFKNQDIYQLTFYANLLNTNKAALIYPSFEQKEPAILEIHRDIFNVNQIYGLFICITGESSQEFVSDIRYFVESVNYFIFA